MSFGPALARFIRATIGPLFGYAFHPGAVVSQAGDGRVEVKPDNAAVPAQKGVPLRLGVPGIKVKVGPGTRVRLYFAGGEVGASEVALWEGDGLLELELDASVKVTITAPQVLLGGPTAVQPLVLGTAYRTGEATMNAAWQEFLTALGLYATAIKPIADPAPAPGDATTPLSAAITAMTAAIASFEGGAASYLSTTVKTK